MLSINNIILALMFIICLILGFLVYLRAKKDIVNWTFSIFVLSVAGWNLSILMLQITSGIWWGKLAFAFTSITIASFVLFCKVFPKIEKQFKKVISFLLILPWIGFFIVSVFFTNLLYESFVVNGYIGVERGPLHPIFGLFFMGYLIYAFVYLGWKHKKALDRVEKRQIRYVLLGTLLFAIFSVTANLILPLFGISRFNTYGPAFAVILVVFIAYTITRLHLLNIRVIATELFTALIILVFLIQVLLSENRTQLLLRIGMLALVVFFGYLLIRAVLREIERRREMEMLAKDLAEANKHLKTLMKMKSEFLTVASHQLRTPTGIVYGMLSMLDEGELTPKETKDFIRKAFIGSKRLQEIIRDLLRATELEAGKMELSLEEIDIKSLVKEIMENLEPKAEEKNLEFILKVLTKPLPKIKVDISLIKEAITALVDNAINYTPKGCVKIILETKDKDFIISVKDSGIGVTKEDRKRLFVKFSRGKEALAVVPNGTGLGLYIVKIVTDLHKGKIEVESEGKNKGSTFSIILPMK